MSGNEKGYYYYGTHSDLKALDKKRADNNFNLKDPDALARKRRPKRKAAETAEKTMEEQPDTKAPKKTSAPRKKASAPSRKKASPPIHKASQQQTSVATQGHSITNSAATFDGDESKVAPKSKKVKSGKATAQSEGAQDESDELNTAEDIEKTAEGGVEEGTKVGVEEDGAEDGEVQGEV